MTRALVLAGLILVVTLGAKKVSFSARGIRNNNPGNIRLTDIPWTGKVPNDLNTDGEFEQFWEVENGIRAMARNLRTQYQVKKKQTIEELISAWAPTTENDTGAYILSVERQTGVDAQAVYPPEKIADLVRAIIRHENGAMPYRDDTIQRGITRAGWRV